jgi:23S rRNA A1618 N6-methylase RlmF
VLVGQPRQLSLAGIDLLKFRLSWSATYSCRFPEVGVVVSMMLESRVLSSKNMRTTWFTTVVPHSPTLTSVVQTPMTIVVAAAVFSLELGIALAAMNHVRYTGR